MWDAVQNKKKRIASTLLLIAVTGVLVFYNWIVEAVASAHVMPHTERCDISEIVSKTQQEQKDMKGAYEGFVYDHREKYLEEKEIRMLCEQTGLSMTSVVSLIWQGRAAQLLKLQDIYFAPVTIEEFRTTPLTVSEWLAEEPVQGYKGMPIVDIRDGDILITKNSRFLGWRNGHAGLVVDAEKGLVLEAIMLGSPSQLCRISKWESYPSFLVLRLKEEYMLPEETVGVLYDTTVTDVEENGFKGTVAGNVAAYASEHLVGVPYQLLAGAFESEVLTGTQCAHLVWYAYKQFGIDLDSDGGLFVTPYDIQNSPYLEIVQNYGY